MNGASRLRRRRAVHPDATPGSEVLQPTLRDQIDLPSVRTKHCDYDDTESGGTVPVRPDQLPSPECVAVSPLGVRGVTAPRRATPLAVAIRRVPRDDTASSGDGARRASRRPRKQATRRPLQALIHRSGPPARRVATPSRRRRSAADCDRFDALGVEPPSSAVARYRFLHPIHVSEGVN